MLYGSPHLEESVLSHISRRSRPILNTSVLDISQSKENRGARFLISPIPAWRWMDAVPFQTTILQAHIIVFIDIIQANDVMAHFCKPNGRKRSDKTPCPRYKNLLLFSFLIHLLFSVLCLLSAVFYPLCAVLRHPSSVILRLIVTFYS